MTESLDTDDDEWWKVHTCLPSSPAAHLSPSVLILLLLLSIGGTRAFPLFPGHSPLLLHIKPDSYTKVG